MLALHLATGPFLAVIISLIGLAGLALGTLACAIVTASIVMNIIRALGPLLLGRWIWGFCRIIWTYIFPIFTGLGLFSYLVIEAADRGWIAEPEDSQEEAKQVRSGSIRST
jgi:hypothetical protein